MGNRVTEFMEAVKANDARGCAALLSAHPSELKPALERSIPGWAFGETPLIAAVRSRNREMIDLLLDAGADLNVRTKWWAGGFGVLDEAASDAALAQYLIERGIIVDVHAAARLGKLDHLRMLIGASPDLVHARGGDGMMPLHFAATVEIARYLVEECGADIDARDVDHESTAAQYMVRDRQDIARYLVSRGCKTDILMAAALGDAELVGRFEDVRTCVSPKYFPMKNPHAGGSIYIWTLGVRKMAHLLAREFGHLAIFESLMERSPAGLRLAIACELGEEATARALIGSELTAEDRERIVGAARGNDFGKVRLMLECGWPAGALDCGETALHWAAFHGNLALVQLLVEHGAPLDLTDPIHGGTPLGWAEYGSSHSWNCKIGDYPAVIGYLRKQGIPDPPRKSSDGAAPHESLTHGDVVRRP